MICLNCGYKTGWNWTDEHDYVDSGMELGEFFTSPIELKREGYQGTIERKSVYGCPKCGHLFIDVEEI